MNDNEFEGIINSALDDPSIAHLSLWPKLQKIKGSHAVWSKKFSNVQKQIKLLKTELASITNGQEAECYRKRIQGIKGKIEALWKHEEMYWGMRLRIMWLKWGDRNTKYFHATTIQRKQRNRISMLQISDSGWSNDPGKLKEVTTDFFTELYSLGGPHDFQPIIDQCPSVVREKVNEALTSRITLHEVKNAVFQLGAVKYPGAGWFEWIVLSTSLDEDS